MNISLHDDLNEGWTEDLWAKSFPTDRLVPRRTTGMVLFQGLSVSQAAIDVLHDQVTALKPFAPVRGQGNWLTDGSITNILASGRSFVRELAGHNL